MLGRERGDVCGAFDRSFSGDAVNTAPRRQMCPVRRPYTRTDITAPRPHARTFTAAFEMKGLRKILRVSWTAKKTNEWVLG